MLISIVLPCYNEAKALPKIQGGLAELAQKLAKEKFEFIYVDDGSNDETPKLLHEMSAADKRVRGLRLSRNFGQSIAIMAGLEHASGEAVVVMQADDPPEVIVQMYARWLEGYQVAFGQPDERSRKGTQRFLRLLDRVTPSSRAGGDYHLLDREVVRALLQMPERDRSLSDQISWAGFRQVAVPYERAPSLAKVKNVSLVRQFHRMTDAGFASSFAPLRVAVLLGASAIGIAFFVIIATIVAHLFLDPSRWERGWSSLFVAIFFLGGVQLVSLGVLGEYLARIYGEVKKRPLYFVRERFGFEKDQLQK